MAIGKGHLMRTVYWRIIETGATGHGKPQPEELAREWVAAMNSEYAGVIVHWLE